MSTMPGIKLVCTAPGCEKRTVARRLCHAHYQASWKGGELGQHQALPPREKAATRCPVDHKHAASSTCYIQHQCRCQPCCDAHNARDRHRKRQKAYGRFDTGLVDAEPVREHILALSEFGIGYKRVAELAGVGITCVRNIVWGRQDPGPRKGEIPKRIKRENAERILAVEASIENLGARRAVPARGTHRRVQALVARGWSLSKIAHKLGWTVENFHAMMHRGVVGAATHRAVADLYERLWDAEPPHANHRDKIAYTRALNFAAKQNWLPPLAWDDIDTDPEPATVEQSEQTKGERVLEDVEWLLEAGESVEQITVTLRRSAGAISKLAERYGRIDLARPFYASASREQGAA